MENDNILGSKIKAVAKDKLDVGIDRDNTLLNNILDAYENSTLDVSALENFTTVSQSREQIYQLIDTMSNDETVSAVLETYAEDATETNDAGEIVWCESADEHVASYVSFLLDSLNVDKHIYSWVYSLIKYGDLYLQLYRKSDYKECSLFKPTDKNYTKKALHEEVNLNYHSDTDHYVHYVKAVPNPGDMYELTQMGKTVGFIKAPASVMFNTGDTQDTFNKNWSQYRIKEKDVDIYQANDFVHAALEDNSSRQPEEIRITLDTDEEMESGKEQFYTYEVKRGQSLLYNSFKIWRELNLLENSILLNRLTRSSIVRIMEINVGDMPKEKVKSTLQQIKQMVEQKSAVNTGNSMQEYTNPGPVENIIYVPTKGEIGKITTQDIGSQESSDPKSLLDLDYFNDKLFGSFRVPKQFFAKTDDGAGFNGGDSLSIISSRYAKAIKRIQNTVIQAITDIINCYLLDMGLDNYVNNFSIRMQSPITQSELDRREATNNQVGTIRDTMDIVNNYIEDPKLKLEALKVLLTRIPNGSDLINLVQKQINVMNNSENAEEEGMDEFGGPSRGGPSFEGGLGEEPGDLDLGVDQQIPETPEAPPAGETDELPTFQDMNVDNAPDLEL